MVDRIFTDEFKRAVGGVHLTDPDASRRQRHAEADFFLVLQANVDVDLFVGLDAKVTVSHRLAVEGKSRAEAVIDEHLFAGHVVRGREKFDLFRGVIRQGGRPPERVQVVLEEGFFLEAGIAGHFRGGHGHRAAAFRVHRFGSRSAVYIAGDQLELCVGIGCAGLVDDADPCAEIE